MEQIKHECGIAMIRLLKPLQYYKEKYGTELYALNKLYLMMEKQHNRGQEGAGIASVKIVTEPGQEYMFREKGVPVIFCNDAHRPGIDRELLIWGDHAIVGTPGAQVIPELPIHKEDFVVPKRRYSGFFQTDLDILLKELGVKTVVITGLHTHMCCRHTSADAFCLGYDVVVAKEATNSFTEEDYLGGLAYLKTCYGADAYTNEELISAF